MRLPAAAVIPSTKIRIKELSTKKKLRLPDCGIYIGSAIYVSYADYTVCTGRLFTGWVSEDHDPEWYLEKTISENQGNLVQLWPNGIKSQLKAAAWWRGMVQDGAEIPMPDWKAKKMLRPAEWAPIAANNFRSGEGMLNFVKKAGEQGIYSMLIYGTDQVNPEYARAVSECGEYFLGADLGEVFTFRFEDADDALVKSNNEVPSLTKITEDFKTTVRQVLADEKKRGWRTVMSTGVSFALDYEVAAGLDLPIFEDYAENPASALCRGLMRQYDLQGWGTHMNHEWYCWLPYSCKYRMESFRNGMYIKYMSGSKILINECGNWYLQSNLCQDSPMITSVPKIQPPSQKGIGIGNDFDYSADFVEEARRCYPAINYDSEPARQYRKMISDFYDYVKENGTPAGQPEAKIAIAKGNLDLGGGLFNPNGAIGSHVLADRDPAWFAGQPERGWTTAYNVFFPRPNVTGKYFNRYISGTPFGQVDIISFSGPVTAEFLLENYKLLVFMGWNTSSREQYRVLTDYVKGGGTLFISIPHLATGDTRDYTNYPVSSLVNHGDFTELCGVRITGRGRRFYWATCADKVTEFEFPFPRRFGIMGTCLGKVEIVDPGVETLLVEDERMDPLLFRRRCGQGTVYFLNSWNYPGALDQDNGPGAELNSPGLIGYVLRSLAAKARGAIYITDNGVMPENECSHIMYSYFPEDGSVCLMNIDFDRDHTFFLHLPREIRRMTLQPSEFSRLRL